MLVKVQTGGKATDVWLKRADPENGFKQITTPQGTLGIAFGYDRLPLGFSLKLVDFGHDGNSPTGGDALLASSVRVIDKAHSVDFPAEIALNRPLVYGGFTFSQSGHEATADGQQVSILTASCDPGAFLKYLGGLLICLGLFAMYYKKAVSFFAAATVRCLSKPLRKSPAATAVTALSVSVILLSLHLSPRGKCLVKIQHCVDGFSHKKQAKLHRMELTETKHSPGGCCKRGIASDVTYCKPFFASVLPVERTEIDA